MTWDDAMLRCAWCDVRCRDREELRQHHEQHRREDIAQQDDEA